MKFLLMIHKFIASILSLCTKTLMSVLRIFLPWKSPNWSWILLWILIKQTFKFKDSNFQQIKIWKPVFIMVITSQNFNFKVTSVSSILYTVIKKFLSHDSFLLFRWAKIQSSDRSRYKKEKSTPSRAKKGLVLNLHKCTLVLNFQKFQFQFMFFIWSIEPWALQMVVHSGTLLGSLSQILLKPLM